MSEPKIKKKLYFQLKLLQTYKKKNDIKKFYAQFAIYKYLIKLRKQILRKDDPTILNAQYVFDTLTGY